MFARIECQIFINFFKKLLKKFSYLWTRLDSKLMDNIISIDYQVMNRKGSRKKLLFYSFCKFCQPPTFCSTFWNAASKSITNTQVYHIFYMFSTYASYKSSYCTIGNVLVHSKHMPTNEHNDFFPIFFRKMKSFANLICHSCTHNFMVVENHKSIFIGRFYTWFANIMNKSCKSYNRVI